MGWITGIFGKSEILRDRLGTIGSGALHSIIGDDFVVYTGGFARNCKSVSCVDGRRAIIAGAGLVDSPDGKRLADDDHWARILFASSVPELPAGHYVCCIASPRELIFYNDPIGIRDIFFVESGGSIAFSTHPRHLKSIVPASGLDLAEFAGAWLLFDNLSAGSIYKGWRRMSPHGRCRISAQGIDLSINSWQPSDKPSTADDFYDLLEKYMQSPGESAPGATLGMSGGIDSRMLLAAARHGYEYHTIGDPDNPDVRIAAKLCKNIGLHCLEFNYPDAGWIDRADEIAEYIEDNRLTTTASEFMNKICYKNINDKVIIDGGMGEIARRGFFNSLKYRAKNAIINKDAEKLFPHQAYPRADIFNPEFDNKINKMALESVRELLESMPDASQTGIDAWLDLLALRVKYPNHMGPEQSRMDCEAMGFSPFAMHDLVDTALNIPLHKRLGGRIFRRYIRRRRPELTRLPLVRNEAVYPYRLPQFAGNVVSDIRRKTGFYYRKHEIGRFLRAMKPLIDELINDPAFRQCAIYDLDKIINMYNSFFAGDDSRAGELDWWLTFELFRRNTGLI
ncbi:MAG: asparagine synthase-related protein [Candidatus Kapaibacterium sp.]